MQSILADIYDAALDPERWANVLARVQRHYDAHLGMIAVSYPFTGKGEVVARNGLPSEYAGRWEEHYGMSAWAQAARRRDDDVADVFRGSDLVPTEDILDSPMGRDIIQPLDAAHMLGTIVLKNAAALGHLTIYRNREFEASEVTPFGDLASHIARAFAMHSRAAWIRERASAFEALVESVPFGLVLVDSTARAHYLNGRAERILALRDGISLVSEEIRLPGADAMRGLERAVREVAASTTLPASRLIAVHRPSGRRPFQIALSPAVRTLREAGTGTVLLWITDPEERLVPSTGALQTLFDLTPAEARTAAAIASGETLQAYAGRVGIGYEAARFSLKGAFAKTRTRRQAELAALIHSSLPPVAFEGSSGATGIGAKKKAGS